jgi:hypothetical protein
MARFQQRVTCLWRFFGLTVNCTSLAYLMKASTVASETDVGLMPHAEQYLRKPERPRRRRFDWIWS